MFIIYIYNLGIDVSVDVETNGKRQRCGRGGGRGRCGRGGAGGRPQSCPGRQGPYAGYFPFGGQGPFQGCPFGGPPQQQPKEKKTETKQPKDVPMKDTESAKEKEVPMTTEVNKEDSLKVNIIFCLPNNCNYKTV